MSEDSGGSERSVSASWLLARSQSTVVWYHISRRSLLGRVDDQDKPQCCGGQNNPVGG